SATGHIGLFKFTTEGSVAAGIRRVEAITGEKALAVIRQQEEVLNQLKEMLKNPKDLTKAVHNLLDEKSALQKKIDALEGEKLQQIKTVLLSQIQSSDKANVLITQVEVPSVDSLKQLAYEIKQQTSSLFAVLGSVIGDKPQLAVLIDETLVQQHGLNAGQIVKELAKEIKGGGGGQPTFATAGGSDIAGLEAALLKASHII